VKPRLSGGSAASQFEIPGRDDVRPETDPEAAEAEEDQSQGKEEWRGIALALERFQQPRRREDDQHRHWQKPEQARQREPALGDVVMGQQRPGADRGITASSAQARRADVRRILARRSPSVSSRATSIPARRETRCWKDIVKANWIRARSKATTFLAQRNAELGEVWAGERRSASALSARRRRPLVPVPIPASGGSGSPMHAPQSVHRSIGQAP
jgi:hypothetical protein